MAARKKTTDEAASPSTKPAAKKAPKAPKKAKERDLTRELGQLLAKTLLPDLRERARLPANHPHPEATVHAGLVRQYEAEKAAKRTGDDEATWIARVLEQIGVAWILSCAFLRTLEDRGFLTHARLAGEGALDAEHLFFDLFPSLGLRDYLLATFRELSHLPGGREVLGPAHNPAWRLAPSGEALRALVAFFRETDESGQLVWRFGRQAPSSEGGAAGDGAGGGEGDTAGRDAIGDTRFLGDLYQDVSEGVRERYALLQTPVFVEEFILDLTLDPAIAEYGLDAVRIIDPTCGSGHFLLGAFRRLFDRHQAASPGLSRKELAGKALAQVYGVDLNPFAAAIARFRLVLAYLDAAGIEKLKDAPELPTQVIVADSLLHRGKGQTRPLHEIAGSGAEGGDAAAWGTELFALEDPAEARRVFGQEYHAVVGNPPYITCKDPVLRKKYAAMYESCAMNYALGVPFTERFFQLAVPGGFVGLINANSFMKREFGKKLIEEVLKRLELTHVFDTSGAYIPGHGTPTVLLFGRNRAALSSAVRAVLGKRGEPETPADAASGLVWSDIEGHWREVGFDSEYVSVVDAQRATFDVHPWSLGGGGAAELKELLEARAVRTLGDVIADIGFGAILGEDDAYVHPAGFLERRGIPSRPLAVGEDIRDWSHVASFDTIYPFDAELRPVASSGVERRLWPLRAVLENRVVSGSTTMKESGRHWFDLRRLSRDKMNTPLTISFAEVATHNHFVLDRGGKVFKQTAPIIKLPEGATEDDHLALLAYLNSSTVCFWMKQVCQSKANHDVDRPEKFEPGTIRYQFAATAVSACPIANAEHRDALLAFGRQFEALEAVLPRPRDLADRLLANDGLAPERELAQAEVAALSTKRRKIALQEDLDWFVLHAFGLVRSYDPLASADTELGVGERVFESDACPPGLDADVWRRRRQAIAGAVGLVENQEIKRRWVDAGRGSFAHEVRTLRERVAEMLAPAVLEEGFHGALAPIALSFLKHGASGRHASVAGWLDLLDASWADATAAATAVPYLAALRHTDAGLEKRALWEKTWDLQRREDAGETVSIPVPPKYDAKDFRDPNYFRLRGKLDVPKERFISYPGAEKDDDRSPLYGWAGWDHLQQATALAALYHERKTEDGWPPDRLVPLLAGLLELVPWLKQWHNAPHDDFGGDGPGDWYERYVEAEARSLGKDTGDLRAWRPEKKGAKR